MKLIKVKCKDAPPSLDLFGYKWYKGKQRGMNAYWTFSKKHRDIVLFIDDNPVKPFLSWNPIGGKDMVECWRKWQQEDPQKLKDIDDELKGLKSKAKKIHKAFLELWKETHK